MCDAHCVTQRPSECGDPQGEENLVVALKEANLNNCAIRSICVVHRRAVWIAETRIGELAVREQHVERGRFLNT